MHKRAKTIYPTVTLLRLISERSFTADNEVPLILKRLAQPYSDRCIIGDFDNSILKTQAHNRTTSAIATRVPRFSFKATISKPM